MRSASIIRGLVTALSVALLAGCGGTQSDAVPPATSTQSRAHQPSGSSGDLLYVVTTGNTYILDYRPGCSSGFSRRDHTPRSELPRVDDEDVPA